MASQKQSAQVPIRFARDPFGLMREMSTEFGRLFDRSLPRLPRWPSLGRPAATEPGWYPDVDVFEHDNRLVTKIDLPGMKKEDVKVEITDGQLAISGERKTEAEEKGEHFYRCERDYGSFFRSVPLPEGTNADDVKATFTDGVLEVRVPLPARPEAKARRIEIEEPKAAKSAA
jgi:HSP20 family protein